jgi:NADPH:quinone reductase-like Zn-dependent oxidoreductase
MASRVFRRFRDTNSRGLSSTLAPDAAAVRVGDDVYALSWFCRDDSAAEFIAIRAADLAPKPHSLNFEHVAAVPLAKS